MKHLLLLSSVVMILAGCTNNRFETLTGLIKKTTQSPLDGVIIPATESALVLTRVVRNSSSPVSVLDLIGDESGSIGKLCVSTETTASASNTGASTCVCSFTYTLSDGSTQNHESQTIYHEANLLRCRYSDIPSGVSSVKIKIHATSIDKYSTEFTFNLSQRSVTLDPASESSFWKVQRYQCRDSIWIPHSLSPSNIYDPLQSEDLHNSYPLNFYSSNLGATLGIYGGGVAGVTPAKNWNCPSIPNDPRENLNLTLYSVAADENGSKKIYPPSGSKFDRSTFYLAKKATSIFDIPLNAYIAPGINTLSPDSQGNQTGIPPIGYGASPISNGIVGQEQCPADSITKPAGYHWVKVWLFRMALPGRKALVSNYLNSLGPIACAPGDWSAASLQKNAAGTIIPHPNNSIFPDCYNNSNTSVSGASRNTESLYLTDLKIQEVIDTGAKLSSRVFENLNACFNIDPNFHLDVYTGSKLSGGSISASNIYSSLPASVPSSSASPAPLPAAGASNTGKKNGPGQAETLLPGVLGLGTDVWNQNMKYDGSSPNQVDRVDPDFGCWGPRNSNPAHLCSGVFAGTTGAAAPQPFYPIPYDDAPSTINIDDPSNPRYDFIFVVTPPEVHSGDMTNPSSSVHRIYTPYRFMSKDDCQSIDPDLPDTAGDCKPQRVLRNYGIKFHDISSAGDPPGNDPHRAGVFPLCALQPDGAP